MDPLSEVQADRTRMGGEGGQTNHGGVKVKGRGRERGGVEENVTGIL